MLTPEEFAQVLDTEAEDIEVDPTDEIQCGYDSSSMLGGVNVIRGQDMSAMATDEQVDLAGIPGTRLAGSDALCGIGVQLDSEDPEQQFSVIGSAVPSKTDQSPCDIADSVAIAILDKLPE